LARDDRILLGEPYLATPQARSSCQVTRHSHMPSSSTASGAVHFRPSRENVTLPSAFARGSASPRIATRRQRSSAARPRLPTGVDPGDPRRSRRSPPPIPTGYRRWTRSPAACHRSSRQSSMGCARSLHEIRTTAVLVPDQVAERVVRQLVPDLADRDQFQFGVGGGREQGEKAEGDQTKRGHGARILAAGRPCQPAR